MPIKTFSARFLLLISLLGMIAVSATQAAGNGAVTAANSMIGANAGDQIGTRGAVQLPSGNIVISSPDWNQGRGAVTCLTPAEYQTGGIVITASNSLTGSSIDDYIGEYGVTVLSNGNYVVGSPYWDNGELSDVGAVTWVNGSTCIPSGESNRGVVVSEINSLVGSTDDDQVSDVTALTNGHYVVSSSAWDNGIITDAGAATWVNGTTGLSGTISETNSLVGTTLDDRVGSPIVALSNGNYLVVSSSWTNTNGSVPAAGAVTYVNGTTGLTGTISESNSLVGTHTNDNIGSSGVVELINGNYVVASANWTNNAGAVTWASGVTGLSGVVDTSNSLTGNQAYQSVGIGGILPLANGHYVVNSYNWDNPSGTSDVGAITWANGTQTTAGLVSTSNSLIGSTANDQVGGGKMIALTNGSYVVSSLFWDKPAPSPLADVGAVTWRSGASGTSGVVSTSNSLIGRLANDRIGNHLTALTNNNNYVVTSLSWQAWNNGAIPNAGAVTWVNGTTGTTGIVSETNSLVGSASGDMVGHNHITALTNGNYVVNTAYWSNDKGAVTWGNGAGGTIGPVSAANSLVGSTAEDRVGSDGIISDSNAVTALPNGNYVVRSVVWDNAGFIDAGAVTWANGSTGLTGTINASNSLVGNQNDSRIGIDDGGLIVLSNGQYVVASPFWGIGQGAVTWGGSGATGLTGFISIANSLVGSSTSNLVGSGTLVHDSNYGVVALTNGNYLVISPYWDNGIVSDVGAVTFVNPTGSEPEPEDTLKVELSAATGSGLEGNIDTSSITSITLLVSGGVSTSSRTVNLALTNGTATLVNLDYSQSSLSVTIPAGDYTNETAVNIPLANLAIVGDTVPEGNETFTLTLQNPSAKLIIGDINGDTTTTSGAVYTITNDEAPGPALTINDVSLVEGNSGTTIMSFTVTLNGTVPNDFIVTSGISGGTATAADNDFSFSPLVLFFNGTTGQTRTINVTINGDAKFEANETFTVSLNNPSASVDVTDTGTGTIINDDVVPTGTLTIADVSASEDNSGTSTMTFTATLAGTGVGGFTVNTGAANGTATSGSDYTFTPSTLTFAGTNGEAKTFTVTINGDTQVEPNETLTVSLNTVSNPAIDITDTAIGTINNDDTATVTIADVSLVEGNAGTSTMTFTATLAGTVAGGFTVDTDIANGTATATSDYAFTYSTLTFAGTEGETKTFTVTINGDTQVEGHEIFTVSLNTISNASVIISDTATGTITNDDIATGTVTIADVSLVEGNTGTSTMTFTATLAGNVTGFTVNTGIAEGTASANSDYVFTPSTLTFAGTNGETKTFTVTINGDTDVEENETFIVLLHTTTNLSIAISDTATGTITNDDVLPPFFTWTALPSIANTTLTYELDVATGGTFGATIIASVTTTEPSFVGLPVQPLTDGMKYWRVRGKYVVNATGAAFYTPYTIRNFTIDTAAPLVPGLVEPINTALITATRLPTFKWATATGATSYRLEIDPTGSFGTSARRFSPITALTFVLPNASALSNGTYSWRLIAVDAAGNESISAVRTFTIALP